MCCCAVCLGDRRENSESAPILLQVVSVGPGAVSRDGKIIPVNVKVRSLSFATGCSRRALFVG